MTSTHDNDHYMRLYSELMLVKMNYKKKVDFTIYEQFFRTFCNNPKVEAPHALHAD